MPPLTQAEGEQQLAYLLSLNLEQLMDIKVTIATATQQPINQAPSVVTVITADDIQATGAINLTDVLQGVPGIHIRRDSFTNRPLVQFRGAKATQTLLMVNGNSMKDLMWGFGAFWQGLPANMIERVEIIRGPGSALYGADASAGVINVITKSSAPMEGTEMGLRSGSFNSQSLWLQSGGTWSGFKIGMTADVSHTDGPAPLIEADGQTITDRNSLNDPDPTNDTDVSLAPASVTYGGDALDLRLSLTKGHWRLNSAYSRHADLGVGVTGAGILDPVTRANDNRTNVDLLYGHDAFSNHWGIDAALRYQQLGYSSGSGFQERPPGYRDSGGIYPAGLINQMDSAERRLSLETTVSFSGIDTHTIHIGAGASWQDLYYVDHWVNFGTAADGSPLPAGGPLVELSGSAYAFAPEKRRTIRHLFVQDQWTIAPEWALTSGLRYDHYSDFGATLNPRLALVWLSTDQITTKLLYGQAFRPPSYQELFAITSRSLPNPELAPERSQTIDLSFDVAVNQGLHLNLTLFQLLQSDLISRDRNRQYVNIGDHTIRGLELEALWQATTTLRLAANYTTRTEEEGSYHAYGEPDQQAYLRADWGLLPQWSWNLQTNWVGERVRPSSDSRPAVAANMIVDSTIRHTGNHRWTLAASIRNLLDTDAREYTGAAIANDLPLPGRNIYAEARYKF